MQLSISPNALSVRKRDGITVQPCNMEKIRSAIGKAWEETGLPVAEDIVESIVADVTLIVRANAQNKVVDVERIQDMVELSLMRHGQFEVAKAYILYRQKRSEARKDRLKPDASAIADYIHPSKYARYLPELKRRETYEETVARVEAMHLRRFPEVESDIRWAFDMVREKRVLPSMRSMQFGGPAIEANMNRMFNCTFSFVDRPKVFSEALYLLLCGSGVGFSVQYDHVDKMPELKVVDTRKVRHHTVQDSIEGWADALDRLVDSHLKGYFVEFSFSKIRPEGSPLVTSGGKAPGHLALKRSLERIREILTGAAGRRLRPIECYDIMCHAADAVLSGGIRRSAMICLFSLEDSEMMNAKTGNWYPKTPWRANSNNSVMLKRDEIKKRQFKRIFDMTKQWGEPGFYFCDNLDYGTNPCCEIGLNPVLEVTEEVLALLSKAEHKGKKIPKVKVGDKYTGWAFCNLTEQNAAKFASFADFKKAARAAAIIGTLQAAYTDFPYLGWVSETIAQQEALLGVGMTGIMDSPQIALNREYQREAAQIVMETNREIAARIGTNTASRTTCVKPSGTTSLELGCVASGHHEHHARRYIRRVVANELEPVFVYFRSINPHMCVRKPDGNWVIEFPVEAPDGAQVKGDHSALEFLELVKGTQVNWVLPGNARPSSSPGLNHNVSNTCTVKPDEWSAVADYLFDNREYFTGVSLIASSGDKDYSFSPNEAVTTDADEAKWNYLITHYTPVDYSKMVEDEDGTDLTGEAACVGGACLI